MKTTVEFNKDKNLSKGYGVTETEVIPSELLVAYGSEISTSEFELEDRPLDSVASYVYTTEHDRAGSGRDDSESGEEAIS